ncbi:MAG TPA: hypothetical protein VMQ62_13710 [Dongiaceae bacterium]|nr:hypothetical protein [Dongiaceae bacterium]
MSLAKVLACVYALLGLIFGAVFSIVALVAGSVAQPGSGGPLMGLFGVAAVIVLPVCYAGLGFVGALIMAGLYNMLAGVVGGVQLDLQPTNATTPPRV